MLMETAAELGCEVYGVEGAEMSVAALQKKFGTKRVFAGWLEQIDFDGMGRTDYFDVVTMADVLEHTRDPNQMLTTVNRILKTGGVAACYIPSTSSLTAKMMGKRWDFYCTQHIFAFSNSNLRTLFDKHGFDIVSLRAAPRYLMVEYARIVAKNILHGGLGEKMLPVLNCVPKFLAQIVVPLYCGQVLLLVRKR